MLCKHAAGLRLQQVWHATGTNTETPYAGSAEWYFQHIYLYARHKTWNCNLYMTSTMSNPSDETSLYFITILVNKKN